MSTMVELPDDIYVQLENQAKARGLTILQTIALFVEETERTRIAAAIERLRAKGLLLVPTEPARPTSTSVKLIHAEGQPLSEAIIEERR